MIQIFKLGKSLTEIFDSVENFLMSNIFAGRQIFISIGIRTQARAEETETDVSFNIQIVFKDFFHFIGNQSVNTGYMRFKRPQDF